MFINNSSLALEKDELYTFSTTFKYIHIFEKISYNICNKLGIKIMDNNSILEPRKMYFGKIKQEVVDASTKYFDDLVKTANVNEDENDVLTKKYEKNIKNREQKQKKLNASKGIRTLFIILVIVGLICFGVGMYFAIVPQNLPIGLSLLIPGIAVAILFFTLIFTYSNKLIKHNQKLFNEAKKEEEQSFNEVKNNIAPLIARFDETIPTKIIRSSVPLIQIDDYFDIEKFEYMNEKYGFMDNEDQNSSTTFVMSGSIVGNPFLLLRNLNKTMYDKLYTGSIVISWSETVSDGKGGTRTVMRTQTLTASVRKPAPRYDYYTHLVYANDAAPKLSFSRKPSGVTPDDEKAIEKFVEKKAEEIRSYADKALKQGKKFTPFTNEKFEALFGGTDRDNEVEFRLLFTPLAQQNLIDLITHKEPFGDDFTIIKRKCLNYLSSNHSQQFDISGDPTNYIHYNVKESRKKFVEYISNYFKGLYFDLAPLISIPLYQQNKPFEYIYKKDYGRNYTSYDEEALVNHFDQSLFLHPASRTHAILKIVDAYRQGKTDQVTVRAHSYRTEPRVDYIPVLGGDGRTHAVPVHWDEYIPLEQDTAVNIKRIGKTRHEFNGQSDKMMNKFGEFISKDNSTYNRGYFGYVSTDNKNIDSEIDEIFRYNDN